MLSQKVNHRTTSRWWHRRTSSRCDRRVPARGRGRRGARRGPSTRPCGPPRLTVLPGLGPAPHLRAARGPAAAPPPVTANVPGPPPPPSSPPGRPPPPPRPALPAQWAQRTGPGRAPRRAAATASAAPGRSASCSSRPRGTCGERGLEGGRCSRSAPGLPEVGGDALRQPLPQGRHAAAAGSDTAPRAGGRGKPSSGRDQSAGPRPARRDWAA